MTDKIWHRDFGPSYTPLEMLELGIFEGKYINAVKGLPSSWYKLKTVVGPKDPPNVELNHFKVKSRQPLSVWRENGWIKTDKCGAFEWYCHYYLGRRLGEEDDWQIGRWKSFVARHMGQVAAKCNLTTDSCNTRQRQGLLQWGWDSHKKYTPDLVLANAKRMAKLTGCKLQEEPPKKPKVAKESISTNPLFNW